MAKKKILLCWGYYRKGWVFPFETQKEDFDFVYLFFRNPDEEEISYTDCTKIYWHDFNSAKAILKQVKPDKIIFMSLLSSYSVALNAAARHRKIRTYILQHGLFLSFNEYRKIELLDKEKKKANSAFSKTIHQEASVSQKLKPFLFLLRSLKPLSVLRLPLLFSFFYLVQKRGRYYALKKLRFSERLPDRYICFTERNATIHREVDGATDSQIDYIGVPELDPYFQNITSPKLIGKKYYLYIDQPFAENQWLDVGVTTENANQVYQKLAAWCSRHDALLVVKLHPENYQSTWLLKDPTIQYMRETDTPNLVRNAEGVFGTTSTLMLPSVYLKPVFLLLIHDSGFQRRVKELGLAVGADFFSFESSEINFDLAHKDNEALKKFEYEFLYKADGQSLQRLKELLNRN